MDHFGFIVIPFKKEFDKIATTIKKAAQSIPIEMRSAKDNKSPGFVMSKIEQDIEAAAFVVVDLTGQNANVCYEAGIATTLKNDHQVIFIVQDAGDVPYDLRFRDFIEYSTTEWEGNVHLENELTQYMKKAISGKSGPVSELFELRSVRTKRIIKDCTEILESGGGNLKDFTIRSTGALSSLAISDNEEYKDDRSYQKLLVDERNQILKLIDNGALFKAIIAPRMKGKGFINDPEMLKRLDWRFERIISFLETHTQGVPSARIEFALIEPFYVNNTLMLGDNLLWDGIKANISGGFGLSIRLTDEAQIAARAEAFDTLFEAAGEYTCREYGSENKSDLASACLNGLKQLQEEFRREHNLHEDQ